MMEKIYKRKTKTVVCSNCGCNFDKFLSDVIVSEKKKRKMYCSRSCAGKSNVFKNNFFVKNMGNTNNFNSKTKLKDEFTEVRWFIRRIKSRTREFNVTVEYLKDLWNNQNICPYTGVKLVLPKTRGVNNPIYSASIDRIDSSIGYVIGNIQYVSMAANYMKGAMSHEQTIELCKTIADFWNKKQPFD